VEVPAVGRTCDLFDTVKLGCPRQLFDHNGLDRALVCGLLDSVFVFSRDISRFDLRNIGAHFEDLRAGIAAQAARRASILYPYSHTCLH